MPVDIEKIRALAQKIQNLPGNGYSGVRNSLRKSLLDRRTVRDNVLPVLTSGPQNAVRNAVKQYFNPKITATEFINQLEEQAADIRERGERYDGEYDYALGEVENAKIHEDAKRLYLGYPTRYGTIEEAQYGPTIGRSSEPYQINRILQDDYFEEIMLPAWSAWKTGVNDGTFPVEDRTGRVVDNGRTALVRELPYVNNATLSQGFDDKGQYLSLYDVWDYNRKGSDKSGDNVGKFIGGKPFELYHRFYLDDWLDIPQKDRGNPWIAPAYITDYATRHDMEDPEWSFANGGTLLHDYRSGGKIHIKPENRGKFTALKKRTGHSASWFKAHGTPAQKKMAVFELNSRHWGNRKDGGGYLLGQVYDLSEEQVQELMRQGYEVERV